MYVSSILKENGHETCMIDVRAERLSKEEVVKRIKEFDADMVGSLVIPMTAKIALGWIEHIKDATGLPVIVGNYAMLHYPEAVMSNDFIDYGIIGSAREAFPKLIDSMNGNDIGLEDIEGLTFKRDGKVIVNHPDEITEELDKLPWPDREEIDNSLYHSMMSKRNPFTLLSTSYGCVFNCDFCDMGNFGYCERNAEEVVDEIEHCVKEHGIKEIDIFDRDFLINKERSKRICKKIIDRDLDLVWTCRTRVDQVDEETLSLMKRAGCRLILYGVESGNQGILDREHKGITLEEIKNALALTKEAGIETLGFFIIGHPGETEEEIKETIQFAKELPLDYAQFFKMTGKPGAKIWEEVTEELGYDYFDKLIRGEVEEMDLPRPWTDLSNREIEKWVEEAYYGFYLRPSYIFKRLKGLKSLGELKRYVKVGLQMLSTKLTGQ